METYLFDYVDCHGQHCEAVDGWDQEHAVEEWYAAHRGERCQLAGLASSGNAGAYSAQYGEPIEPASAEDIEAAALEYLADRLDMSADHFGPIGVEIAQEADVLTLLSALEAKAHKWQDGERYKMQRAEKNAVAFDDVGQLPRMTAAEIEAKMRAAGADRIILAEFCIDESDSQSDYFGGRTSREVVIGFGKGRRENFRQLRAAAGKFPPTAHMGPGKDIYQSRVVLLDDVVSNGAGYWHGTYSHWHHELWSENFVFSTLAEAGEHIMSKGDPEPINFDGKLVRFGWKTEHSSYEQRENYSMGGGNYLGTSRYGGWKVRSRWSLGQSKCEVWGTR